MLRMTFQLLYVQETDFKEWKLVVQEIVKFLKADTAFMNIFPLRYSLVLDLHPDCLPQVAAARRKLRLRDAILSSYYPNEVLSFTYLFAYVFFILFVFVSHCPVFYLQFFSQIYMS